MCSVARLVPSRPDCQLCYAAAMPARDALMGLETREDRPMTALQAVLAEAKFKGVKIRVHISQTCSM